MCVVAAMGARRSEGKNYLESQGVLSKILDLNRPKDLSSREVGQENCYPYTSWDVEVKWLVLFGRLVSFSITT
jgi:hypothetical protein